MYRRKCCGTMVWSTEAMNSAMATIANTTRRCGARRRLDATPPPRHWVSGGVWSDSPSTTLVSVTESCGVGSVLAVASHKF